MKKMIMTLIAFSSLSVFANSQQGIICRHDLRLENGPLREVILTPVDGGYHLQSQYVPSLNSPTIEIETWAEKIACRLDEKAPLAFCQTENGQSVVQFKEQREVFYDSLEENEKKKIVRNIGISLNENGVNKKALSFAASHCQLFGGET